MVMSSGISTGGRFDLFPCRGLIAAWAALGLSILAMGLAQPTARRCEHSGSCVSGTPSLMPRFRTPIPERIDMVITRGDVKLTGRAYRASCDVAMKLVAPANNSIFRQG